MHIDLKATGISAPRALDYNRISKNATEKMPADFKNEKNVELEQRIPIWFIDPSDLDPIFDEIRFQRHLIDKEADLYFKRRTTWLFPLDGNDDCPVTFALLNDVHDVNNFKL